MFIIIRCRAGMTAIAETTIIEIISDTVSIATQAIENRIRPSITPAIIVITNGFTVLMIKRAASLFEAELFRTCT